MDKPTTEQNVTVYYDGSCPLCTREIGIYKNARGGSSISWCDISQQPPPPELTREQAMARFHVSTKDQGLTSGATAFITLWQTLPGWRWLGKLASTPPLPWILEAAYRAFLPVRPLLQKLARRIE